MTNKPVALSKRVLAALIDLIAIVVLVMLVMEIINLTPLLTKYNSIADEANGIYNSLAISMNIGELKEVNGVLSLEVNSNVTSSDLTNFQTILSSNNEFLTLYNKAMNFRLLINIIAIGIVEVGYLLLFPLFNKKGQTPGKVIIGLGVLDNRYDMFLDKKNKVIRFLVGFIVETCLMLWIFRQSSAMMVAVFSPMVVLTIIMFSQNKQALHDVLSHANVVDLKTATIFNSIEEKQAYDAELLSQKEENTEVIEAEVEEDDFDKEEVKEIELSKTSVFITDYNKDKTKELTLKLQEITSLSIIDAKAILDNLPSLVKTNLEVEEANLIKEQLESLSAIVEIK